MAQKWALESRQVLGAACTLSTTNPLAQMFSLMMIVPSGLMPAFRRSKKASASSNRTRPRQPQSQLRFVGSYLLKTNCDTGAPSVRYSSAHCIQTKSYLRTHLSEAALTHGCHPTCQGPACGIRALVPQCRSTKSSGAFPLRTQARAHLFGAGVNACNPIWKNPTAQCPGGWHGPAPPLPSRPPLLPRPLPQLLALGRRARAAASRCAEGSIRSTSAQWASSSCSVTRPTPAPASAAADSPLLQDAGVVYN